MADTASQVLLGSGLTALSQPLMYVKVLVQLQGTDSPRPEGGTRKSPGFDTVHGQIAADCLFVLKVGYEPLPPTLGRNIFGRQVYQLPGLFAYAKHIMKIDGRAGLFKGLTPRLCSGAIGTIVHGQVLQRYQEADQEEEPGASLKEPVSSWEQVIKETNMAATLKTTRQTSREMVARSAATLVTHPFHVITLRCMVQFVGRETKYSGIFSPFVTIYREEGILGFFAGLVPRLLGDVLSLWLCNMLAYLINTYALENGVSTMSEMKSYSQAVTGFFASMLTYPFVLVSNLMAINNCGLAGGLPPFAPNYSSWLDCWSQLLKEGNMSRGNSLFFRKVPAGKLYVWEEKRFR
ncbi:mitochondrial carrier homolog 2 isoform X2 [Eretmochelys imbricata]